VQQRVRQLERMIGKENISPQQLQAYQAELAQQKTLLGEINGVIQNARDYEEYAEEEERKAERARKKTSNNCKKNCDDPEKPKLERKVDDSIIDNMQERGIDVHEVKAENSRFDWYQTKKGDVYTTLKGNPRGAESQPVWDLIRNQPLNIRFYQ